MNKQLLVVDDAADIHPLIKALLSSEPVDVSSATDPLYGLTLAESMKPDLILLDVDMPGMDGYEFCRRVKANPNLWSVPVVFFTARGSVDQTVLGLNLGAADYISKPFSPGELLARVRGVLRTQSVISTLEDRSLVDTLTGLGNSKMFETRLRGEVSARARSPRPLSCVYLDLDGFSTVNKYYGEPFGDMILRKVADVLREIYRPEDVVCRLRNDDFAVLMPDTPSDDAVNLARTVRDKLSVSNFRYRDSTVPVTCGIGIASALDPYDHRVLERAMDALQQSANRKSNEVWVAAEADPKASRRAA